MRFLKLITKFMISTIVIIFLLLILFLAMATLSDYRPPEREAISATKNSKPAKLKNNEITILTWNIGYCGLGKEMDFFYEGGKQVRPSIENLNRYMNGIAGFIQTNAQTDFILLQEVDKKAKRSHWMNQVEIFGKILKNHDFVFAKNYDVPFVPVPLRNPMGKVSAGLLNFTMYSPVTSERVSFPGDLGWPNSLFLLDRCYLIQRFVTANDKILVIMNTHNSAFDNGEKRKKQLSLLKSEALKEYQNGNYVVIGGDWNLNPPGFLFSDISNGDLASNNIIGGIDPDLFTSDWTWVYDKNTPTNRQVNSPYQQGKTPVTILDFFLLSPNIKFLEINAFDLGFEYSDHNPVKIKLMLL